MENKLNITTLYSTFTCLKYAVALPTKVLILCILRIIFFTYRFAIVYMALRL